MAQAPNRVSNGRTPARPLSTDTVIILLFLGGDELPTNREKKSDFLADRPSVCPSVDRVRFRSTAAAAMLDFGGAAPRLEVRRRKCEIRINESRRPPTARGPHAPIFRSRRASLRLLSRDGFRRSEVARSLWVARGSAINGCLGVCKGGGG